MTLAEALRRGTDYLQRHDVPSPRVDAEHLLGKALGLSLQQNNDLAGARNAFRRAVDLDPKDTEARNSLGFIPYCAAQHKVVRQNIFGNRPCS